jgi:hypothetical protein
MRKHTGDVDALVPLDAIPKLAIAQELVPCEEIGDRASEVVMRIDGRTCTMAIVTGLPFTPSDAARELAELARLGVVRLVVPHETAQ